MAKKEKKLTHAQLKKKVDEWFSKYVRYEAADQDGNCICFTCGKQYHATKIQAGHFASRRYANVRWCTDNVKPQCVACNIYGQGEQYVFGRNLEMQRRGLPEEIMRRAHESRKFTIAELRDLYAHYRSEAIQFARQKNIVHDKAGATKV